MASPEQPPEKPLVALLDRINPMNHLGRISSIQELSADQRVWLCDDGPLGEGRWRQAKVAYYTPAGVDDSSGDDDLREVPAAVWLERCVLASGLVASTFADVSDEELESGEKHLRRASWLRRRLSGKTTFYEPRAGRAERTYRDPAALEERERWEELEREELAGGAEDETGDPSDGQREGR